MDEHFRLGIDPPTGASPHDPRHERIGIVAAAIFFIGLSICISLLLVAGGIAAVRWAL
jgi:hypothetical protein